MKKIKKSYVHVPTLHDKCNYSLLKTCASKNKERKEIGKISGLSSLTTITALVENQLG